MDLNEIAVFVKIVQLGSFSAAARALTMPNSTVSARLSALEARLGLTLIQRTTRRMAVTPAGHLYYEQCLLGLKQLEAAEAEVLNDRREPRGVLRLTTPVELGHTVLPTLLAEFMRAYPVVQVDAALTDRHVRLVEEGFDLALRAGHLKDSTLVVRRIADVSFSIFASPEFLRRRGTPREPQDVDRLEGIRFSALGQKSWVLTKDAESVTVAPVERSSANDLNLIKRLAVRGLGVALLPAFFCADELRDGSLVQVLPGWRSQLAPLQFVYPAQKYVPANVAAFMALALPRLRELLGQFA
jgi:DNA-binding transcriptional LysR family regulator